MEREHPQNLAWIHAAVSEKLEFTDGPTDGRTDDGRLRHDSSSADKSSRAKIVISLSTENALRLTSD